MNGRKIIINKRFSQNSHSPFKYLLTEFSAKVAYEYIFRPEKRIEFIAKNPLIDKKSTKRKDVRSILFKPYCQIFYRYQNGTIEVLCIFNMRRNPEKNRINALIISNSKVAPAVTNYPPE